MSISRSRLVDRVDTAPKYLYGVDDKNRTVAVPYAVIESAAGDGITDDTAAIKAAIEASYGGDLYLPSGTYMVSAITVSQSLRVHGPGTLKQIASTSDNMLTTSGTSTKLTLDGITLDGNQANQAADNYATIKHTAVGTSSDPAVLEVVNCTFLNGRWADITVLNDAERSTLDKVVIRGNKFFGGKEGATQAYAPRYIDIRSCVDYAVTDNVLDFCGTPAAFGRAGILAYDGHDTTFYPSRGIISGNHLHNVGRAQSASILGAIDLYDTGRSTTISGNMLVDCYGRGIQCKADSESLAIVGNTVDGLLGATDADMNGQIVVNASTRTAYEGSVAIVGNALLDSGKDGIAITQSNSNDTGFASGVLISANTIRNPTRRAIGLVDVSDVTVIGNAIDGGSDNGVYVQDAEGDITISNNRIRGVGAVGINVASSNTTASFLIQGNSINGTTGRGIYVSSGARGQVVGNSVIDTGSTAIEVTGTDGPWSVYDNASNAATPFTDGGSNTQLYVGRNDFENALTTTAHTVTIASGAITATMDYHWVDTESSAASDNLDTINGGYDGMILTLRARDNARTVVVKDGTQLRLAGDMTLDNVQDTITLRYITSEGVWLEIGRADAGA